MSYVNRLLLAAAMLIAPAVATAQQRYMANGAVTPALNPAREALASRVTAPPVLDGRDDDAAWQNAMIIDQFLEYEPNEGAETRFRTEVRVTYDDRHLYVLARMHDPAPDSIVSLLSRRDVRTPSEQLKLVIDSYHDRRTAYQFITNPAGVKRDFYVYNDGVEDVSWDAVWDVATAIDSLGWVAEFRIPLSQLRFANKEEHTFGLLIVRDVARTGARISWPLYRRNVQGYVSQGGEIHGIKGIQSPRRIEIVPYAVTKNVTRARLGDTHGFEHPQQITGGADLKLGVTSNLTLDATVNPDFGQVEADPAVLNLSSFETFFQERRPFFLEGAGIFRFDLNCNDGSCSGLFYSRRIGRSPQLRSQFGDARSSMGTTILGAGKLTGRTSNGLSVGFLNAHTQREIGTEDRTIEPRTNYAVARLQQDIRSGNSGVGLMITGVHRDLDEYTAPTLRREAYTAGVDFRHRMFERRYELSGFAAYSSVAGSADAIALLQRDPVHRFQRPDGALTYDPTRTSLTGDAQQLSLSKIGGGIVRFNTAYRRYSPGFEANDVGFLSRADEQMWSNWVGLQFNKPGSFHRRAFVNFNQWTVWNDAGLPISLGGNVNGHLELHRMWWLRLGLNANSPIEVYDDRKARGGPAIRRSQGREFWTALEFDARKRVAPSISGGMWRTDEGATTSWWVSPSVALRASSRLSGSLGVNYSRNDNDSQWLRNIGDAGADTTHYTFARLEQTTLGLTSRVNLTATPNLSFQFYAQPFVSTGDYSNWRELADPRAARHVDRYKPYDGGDPGGFRAVQFNSNSVMRWEYRPGSTLFLVWSQGRSQYSEEASEFSLGRDMRAPFSLHPDNTFLIKVSYWFNP